MIPGHGGWMWRSQWKKAAAEHLNTGDCCIWNMFPGNPRSARQGEGLTCTETRLKRGNGEKECATKKAILLRLSRDVLEERPVHWER